MLESNNKKNSSFHFLFFILFLLTAIFLNCSLANATTNNSIPSASTTQPAATTNSASTATPTANSTQATGSIINYTVQNVDASQIIKTLQNLYGNSINIVAQQQQLLIRTNNPSQMAEIQNLLPQLDKAPRQVLITVRQNVPASELQTYLDAANGNVAGQPTQSMISTQDRGAQGDYAEIQATEGQPARVNLTQSVPLITQAGNNWGPYGAGAGSNAGGRSGGSPGNNLLNSGGYVGYSYANLMTGFDVTVKILGDTALLDITSFNGAPVANSYNNTETSNQHTTLRVPLGQWALIGGTGILDTKGSTTYQTGRSTDQGNSATIIRVTAIGGM